MNFLFSLANCEGMEALIDSHHLFGRSMFGNISVVSTENLILYFPYAVGVIGLNEFFDSFWHAAN